MNFAYGYYCEATCVRVLAEFTRVPVYFKSGRTRTQIFHRGGQREERVSCTLSDRGEGGGGRAVTSTRSSIAEWSVSQLEPGQERET